MKYFQRKQIVVLSLVLMLVIAGYLQYSYNKSSQYSEADSAQPGDTVYVDNQDVTKGETAASEQKAVTASKEVNNYFAQAKMDRESVRDKDIETIKTITSDETASKDAKVKAQEKMLKLVDIAEKEENIETLIKGKGFSDAIALFSDDGKVDIIVKSPAISKADTAKIVDIVVRQGNVSFDKIVIKNMFN